MTVGGFDFDPEGPPDPEDLDRRRAQAGAFWTDDTPAAERAESDRAARVARLLAQARQKLAEESYQPAIARLNEVHRIDPASVEGYLLKIRCMLGLDEPARAVQLLDTAERHANAAEERAAVAALRQECERAMTADYLERARQRLRRGDAERAAELLRRCTAPDDEKLLDAIRAYTDLRRSQEGDRPAERWLDAGERETVLRWLTREELAAAEAAIDDERFDVALRACAGARQMDAHGAYAALLRATALFGRVASGGVQGADEIERMLDGALKSARYAQRDPSFGRRCTDLIAAIERVLATVHARQAANKKLTEVNAVIDKYVRVRRQYDRSVLYTTEVGNMLASLAPIAVEVARLRRKHPPDSEAGKVLKQIADDIADIRRHFRR